MTKLNYKQFCEDQAQSLLNIITEHNGLMNWRRTWKTGNKGGYLPMSKNGYYSGINLTTLLMVQSAKGYASNKWLTFNQIKDLEGSVNKGEKSTCVCFFSMKEITDKETGKLKKIPLLRYYNVFNLDQTNLTSEQKEKFDDGIAETLSKFNIDNFQLDLRHGGDRAFYNPNSDHVQMPPLNAFENENAYAATFLHELVHWTGGREARLPRECSKQYSFDMKQRAIEELIAEMGSVFLTAHYNIDGDVKNHASYVASWKRDLELSDIALAIKEATKAFKFILDIASTEHQAIAA